MYLQVANMLNIWLTSCDLQPDLQGMLPVENAKFTSLQKSAFRWPDRLKQAAALCNTLTLINRNHVVGDVPEREAFKAVEAQFLVSLEAIYLSLSLSSRLTLVVRS